MKSIGAFWSKLQVKRFAAEALWVAGGQFVAFAGMLLGLRLMTNAFPPAEIGRFALAATVAALAQQLVFSPLSAAMLRYFNHAREEGTTHDFLSAGRILFLAASVAAVTLVVTSLLIIGGKLGSPARLLLATTVVYTLLSGAYSFFEALQNAERLRARVAWNQAAAFLLRPVCAVLLADTMGSHAGVVMLGYSVGLAPLVMVQAAMAIARTGGRSEQPAAAVYGWRHKLVTYGAPFSLWGLFSWMQVASDRWALGTVVNETAVGLYNVLFQTGYYPIVVISTLATQLVSPIVFQRVGTATDAGRMSNAQDLARVTTYLMIGVTVLAVLLGWAFHRFLFSIVVAPSYRSVSGLLPWMILSGGAFSVGQAACVAFLAAGDTRSLLLPKIVTALLGAGMNLAGAWYAGITGVVIGMALHGVIYAAWILLLPQDRYNGAANPALGNVAATV